MRCLDAAGLTVADVDVFVPHQANQRIIDHAARRLGIPEERVFGNVAQYGNTSAASIPLALDEAYRGGDVNAGDIVLMVGLRRRAGVGLVRDGVDEGALMARIAFCFPGQGSQRVGMGAELVQQFPEAAAVFAEASDVLGFDLGEGLLQRADRGAVAHRADAAGAGRDVDRRAARGRGAHRPDARRGRRPQRRRVRRAARGGRGRPGVRGRLVRERGLVTAAAAAADPGAMAAVLGLADAAGRGAVRGGDRRLAGELQLPGPGGHLRPGAGRRRGLRPGQGGGRQGDPAARHGRVPQPADGRRRRSLPARPSRRSRSRRCRRGSCRP